MYRYIQFEAATGRLVGSLETVERDADGVIVQPLGKVIIDSDLQPDAATARRYDAEKATFEQPPAPTRLLTKADVIAALPPVTWATLNRYHPAATEPVFQNADVYWAMSLFHAVTRPFAYDDARVGAVLATLVRASALSPTEADQVRSTLSTLAHGA